MAVDGYVSPKYWDAKSLLIRETVIVKSINNI